MMNYEFIPNDHPMMHGCNGSHGHAESITTGEGVDTIQYHHDVEGRMGRGFLHALAHISLTHPLLVRVCHRIILT